MRRVSVKRGVGVRAWVGVYLVLKNAEPRPRPRPHVSPPRERLRKPEKNPFSQGVIATAARLAQLGERRSAEREGASSNPGWTNTQGLKNN